MGDKATFIVIPQQAVVEVDGHPLAYVETTPGDYVQREVKVEKAKTDQVRVLDGLTAGERIVARGAVLH